MRLKNIALILFTIFCLSAAPAMADDAKVMSDAELASYISGKLNEALKDTDFAVKEFCDHNGCSVVVQ